MAYIDQFNLANGATFQNRVKVAMTNAALAIQSELASVANHNIRAKFAHTILHNIEAYTSRFALAIVTADPTLTAGSSDTEIQTQVNAVWDAFSAPLNVT